MTPSERDDLEARHLAQEIRDGLDSLLEEQHDRLADAMRDRQLIAAARKLRGRP